MTAPTAPVLALLAILAVTPHGLAADPALDKWEAARDSFVATRDKLRTQVLESIDAAEARARKAGNAVLVERIKRDRETFAKHNIPPRHVTVTQWARGMPPTLFSLKQAAQRATAALVKEGRDKEAAAVEAELAKLLGPPPPAIPIVGGGPDPRFYWANTQQQNHIRLLANGDWEEYTPGDGKKYIWKEISRDHKSIEIFEPHRKLAMRLQAANAHVDHNFDGSRTPQFSHWSNGRWYNAPEAIAYLDAEDDAADAIKKSAAKASK